MNLADLENRKPVPEPWAEGEKIPWDEPGFSARMLREHLSQDHDLASRRSGKIDAHVDWIHRVLLKGRPSRVLDLGCGPGLYASRLAARGHDCVGIDFSPASVAYATENAEKNGLACRYALADVRHADYGAGFDLVMLIFGEFNVFRPAEARTIVGKAHRAIDAGGALLLEPSTFEAVHEEGSRGPSWYAATSGLFSAQPHLCLTEHFWNPDRRVATTRYYIVESTSTVTPFASSSQAYTVSEYRDLLRNCGFDGVVVYPSLTGEYDESQADLFALTARKPG